MAPSTEHNETSEPTPGEKACSTGAQGIPHLCSSQKVNTKLKDSSSGVLE